MARNLYPILHLSGKARQVFLDLEQIIKAWGPESTLGELLERKGAK